MEGECVVRLPGSDRTAELGTWKVCAGRGRILASSCTCADQNGPTICRLCEFYKVLNFHHLPDMVFADNRLSLTSSAGGRIEFSALEALRHVDPNREPIRVACADTWQENRTEVEQKIKSFDWTFTTNYKGTLLDGLETMPTSEKIDMELLKKRERILFYDDIQLFEDELHDQGVASCSVKIRMMPSCWYILLRYFLRVDDVLARINDTRMFYLLDSPHILVEHTSRESPLPELNLPVHIVTDPNELAQHLPITSQSMEKIILPTSA